MIEATTHIIYAILKLNSAMYIPHTITTHLNLPVTTKKISFIFMQIMQIYRKIFNLPNMHEYTRRV